MSNNDDILRDKINGYVKEKGWTSFFGLLATISPEKIDQDDLKKYNETQGIKPESTVHIPEEKFIPTTKMEKELKDASIYAVEHINAVQSDLIEHGTTKNIEQKPLEEPKTKVLTPSQSATPNPWGESKVVLPGELNL